MFKPLRVRAHQEKTALKLYHLLLIVWVFFVVMWLLNATRPRK